ncbi:MAG: response regulator [Clostridiales bacterium]|jgi:putative two-component system response regulator|nr:response regulator [Clostridiales bacterium]
METYFAANRSVLIVDDNATNLKLLQEILKGRYKVYPAPSGERAIAFLEKTIPGLILLDVEMPGMNGYQVIAKLKNDQRWQDIPVIFLTAQEGRAGEEQAFLMGAVDYILKPISAGVVLKRVQLHIELQNYRKNLEQLVEIKTYQVLKSQDTILDILANVTAYRDNETGGHIRRTTVYTQLIVEHLFKIGHHEYRLNRNYADHIIKSAKLHDIGKVAISDSVLLKPGKLTKEEFEFIKKHPVIGARMIDNAMRQLGDDSTFLLVAKEIIYSHHEWWNGKGYPQGLSGDDIPLSGRIMAVADVYDALISDRPYKKAFSHEEAFAIIWEEAGTHFDPYLMELARDVLLKFKDVIYQYQDEIILYD